MTVTCLFLPLLFFSFVHTYLHVIPPTQLTHFFTVLLPLDCEDRRLVSTRTPTLPIIVNPGRVAHIEHIPTGS
ncbi:hypothetical protein F4679DRAFT_58457 [Xylaria curta]|nr:hypothetical protein F4679DRAFT_58457 [Xylaria curta]